ncbi:MAG: HAD family hydrolase [Clostridiales bacterium]|nr:HAD family hydrolase [Clostridiales bacterium]
MKFKFVISDFDGTLGVSPGIINDVTVKAIKEYQQKGGKFVICTGRMYDSAIRICQRHNLGGDLVCYQGATIYDIDKNEVLFSGGLTPEESIEIVNDLVKNDRTVLIDIDSKLYFNKVNFYTTGYCTRSDIKGECREDLVKLIKEKNGVTQKIMCMNEEKNLRKLLKELKDKYQGKYEVNMSGDYLLEVINPACDKGHAVKFLAKRYGIDLKDTMAIGDSLNDKGLLTSGAYGVCVGDGFPELKEVADEVTVPFKENPVEYLLRKYCL